MKCSYCGEENEEGEMFCSKCGMKLEPVSGPPAAGYERTGPAEPESKGKRCEHCGFVNVAGASVCAACNQPLREPLQKRLKECVPPVATTRIQNMLNFV
jgi:uncharacterized protein with PIN domain